MSDPNKRYIPDTAVAARYGIARVTVWRWARDGRIPKPVAISPGCTRWDVAALDRCDAERTAAA